VVERRRPGVEERQSPDGSLGWHRPWGMEAPCTFFFLGHGDGVEELLPLLGGCQGGGFLWLWMDASKNRAFLNI